MRYLNNIGDIYVKHKHFISHKKSPWSLWWC